ncbi:MAG: hypothetical protein F7C81_01020 [Desulfurococcales archaeon]|nr:hypothetical protein [Desulfurococcales archaeon]
MKDQSVIALITIRRYHRDAESISERLNKLGYHVVVGFVDKPYTQLITEADVCRVLKDINAEVRYVIVPYNANVKTRTCNNSLIVRGPRHLYMLPELLKIINIEEIAREEIDNIVIDNIHKILDEAFTNIKLHYNKAWCVDKLCIPIRPPPIIVASDLYASDNPEAVLRKAEHRINSGADFIVLGIGEANHRTYMNTLELLLERNIPVAVDSPEKINLLIDALDTGAHIGFSLTHKKLDSIPPRLREEKAFVIIPEALGEYTVRVKDLARSEEKAFELGYTKILLDPVAQPLVNPGLMHSLITAWHLSRRAQSPIMIGINNAIELLDADSPGAIAVASGLIAESGISIVMVSEESWKARGLTLEARIAADMASLALYWRTTMKDLGLNLLILKEKRGYPA